MAAAPCTLTALVDDSSCYDCLSESDKLAAIVYLYAKTLADLGGTDLTDVNTLREYIACYCVPDGRLSSFHVTVGQNALVAAGARSALTLSELRTATKCLECVPAAELRRAQLILLCLLVQASISAPT